METHAEETAEEAAAEEAAAEAVTAGWEALQVGDERRAVCGDGSGGRYVTACGGGSGPYYNRDQ